MFFLWCFGIFDQNMVENEFFLIRNITTSTFHRPEVVGIWAGQATRRLFFQKIKKRTTNHSFRKKNLKIKRLKHVAYFKPMCLVLFYFYFIYLLVFFSIGSFTTRFLLIFLVYFLFQLHHSITLLIIDWVTQFVLIDIFIYLSRSQTNVFIFGWFLILQTFILN